MKKLLLLNVAGLLMAGVALGQSYSPAGGALTSGSVGATYNQEISFNMPATVDIVLADFGIPSFPGVPATVTATVTSVLVSIPDLPSGLQATCPNGTCEYAPGVPGKIIISGAPTVGGNFTIHVATETSGSASVLGQSLTFPGPNPLPIPGAPSDFPAAPNVLDSDDYTMNIAGGGNAVEELNASTFNVIQNIPNPFSGSTTIKFNTPAPAQVDFVVYDMLGNKVYANKINAETGVNVIKFNAETLSNGAYFYTISNGQKTFTKRMIITGK